MVEMDETVVGDGDTPNLKSLENGNSTPQMKKD
jgi:hypothetical protein